MPVFAFFNPDGTVKSTGIAPTVPAGAYEMPANLNPAILSKMKADPETLGTEAIDLSPRQMSPEFAVSDDTYTLADCPIGTVVKVADMIGGEWLLDMTTALENETVSFTLADPGTYSIEVQFPQPYMPRIQEVVIS